METVKGVELVGAKVISEICKIFGEGRCELREWRGRGRDEERGGWMEGGKEGIMYSCC